MNQENTKKLLEKYPIVFGQYKLSPQETAMCWLFECGDGWYQIIDSLASIIQWENKRKAKELEPAIQAVQVKEKYGTLRFYTNMSIDYIDGAITMAEEMSGKTCEVCGSTKNVTQTEGWIKTRCKKCLEKENERN